MVHPAYSLLATRPLPEHGGVASRLLHRRTKAELVVVRNEDRNNVFAISFGTVPPDDTGIAHVLEHLVFRGSRSYPLTRPFAGLLQGSLHTYLNASTGPDRTTFHLASQNETDFGNLIDVTLDAVLHPLLRPEDFREEAWRVEPDPVNGGLRLGGIVLTEMNGHLAAPVNLLAEGLRRGLFPDTAYDRAYAGDPEHIPSLCHAAAVAYHRAHYHPSNARIFLWGNGDVSARLDQIDRHFQGLEQQDAAPPVPIAETFRRPRHRRTQYPAGAEGEKRSHVGLGWALPDDQSPSGFLAWPFIALALFDLPDAPVTEALKRAGLGRRINWPSLEASWRQPMISLGLEGVERADERRVAEVVLQAIREVAEQGLDEARLETALGNLEFGLEEGRVGRRPRGLVAFDRIEGRWRHGDDPLARLAHEPALAQLRAGLSDGLGPLVTQIRRDLLDNPHRLSLAVASGSARRVEARGDAAAAARLAQLAETPDTGQINHPMGPTPAAPDLLPTLGRGDLPRSATRVPLEVDGPVLRMDVGERSITRIGLTVNVVGLPADRVALVPVLGAMLVERASRASRLAGGFSKAVFAQSGPLGSAAGLILRGKALRRDAQRLSGVMAEALGGPLGGLDLVARTLEGEIARQEARLHAASHQIVDLRLRAGASVADALGDQLDGLGQLEALVALRSRFTTDPASVLSDLEDLRSRLFVPHRLTLGLTGLDDLTTGQEFLAAVARPCETPLASQSPPEGSELQQGLAVSGSVHAVGRGVDLRRAGLPVSGATMVGICALSTGWLWDAVRVAGGAYGAKAVLDPETGMLTLLSFRDPHVLRTLDVYAESGAWLRREACSALADRCVIGAVAQLERPLPPEELIDEVIQRHLVGLTHEHRQAELDGILGAGEADLRALADAFDAALPAGPVVVLGPEASLRAALEERPAAFTIQRAPV